MDAEVGIAWTTASLRDCRIDRLRREVSRDDSVHLMERRAFDVLVYLIEHRDRVVLKQEIFDRCFQDSDAGEAALARAIMKIRQALGDKDANRPIIKTMHRLGYRFVADVELAGPARAEDGSITTQPLRRLALIPFINNSDDAGLAWVELGLVSLMDQALRSTPGWSLVPVQNVFVALSGVPPGASVEQRRQAVEAAFGRPSTLWGRLFGHHSHYSLEFELQSPGSSPMKGTVVGSDPARLAHDAAMCVRRWLAPDVGGAGIDGVDYGDPFYNEAFAMALQRTDQGRLVEAEHLLDVLQELPSTHAELQLAIARVHVLLGRPGGAEEIDALERTANATDSAYLRTMACWLRGIHLEQRGLMSQAASAMERALDMAESGGLSDLAVQCMLACAHYRGGSLDPRAHAMLSRAFPRAERLGNRVLLSEAYWVAGKLAGFAEDWITAARHHTTAVSVLLTMDMAVQFPPNSMLAWTQAQLGQLQGAVSQAVTAFEQALTSGRQPELGLTAGTAAHVCMADRRIRAVAGIYASMPPAQPGEAVSMVLAREVHCRASLLRLAGRFDEALERIAIASEEVQGNPVLLARSHAAAMLVLLKARRFAELRAWCKRLSESVGGQIDPRLNPWIERALALCDLGEGHRTEALARLHAVARTTPICESQAIASLEAAWIHLENDEVEEARRLVAPLSTWMEQTPCGVQVAARLSHASGNYSAAVELQRSFVDTYADSTTDFHAQMLAEYERSAAEGVNRPLPPLQEGLDLHWHIVPELLRELPHELGGTGPCEHEQLRPTTAVVREELQAEWSLIGHK